MTHRFISRDLLIELFPPLMVDASEIQGIAPEVGSYRRDMGGKTWAQVDHDIFERHTDALTLMKPTSLRNFIAGFLAVAIADPYSNSAESLGYHVAEGTQIQVICKHLTPMQSSCLFDVTDYSLFVRDSFSTDLIHLVRKNRLRILFPPWSE